MIEDYPILPKRKYPPLDGNSSWKKKSIWDKEPTNYPIDFEQEYENIPWKEQPRLPTDNYIRCPNCGYSTGLSANGFLMVIPPQGLICHCGTTIIRGNGYTL